MTEFIEREAAIEAIMSEPPDAHYPSWYIDRIKTLSAADVAPVRHGRWERVIPTKSAAKWSTKVSCSNCHSVGYTRYNYCPNCGASMDKGQNEK